jgi:hypothetical protein
MNTELTEIAIVLDRSGSMASIAKEAIGGFNGFLESQQKLPGDARLTLVLFDHEYIVTYDGRPIKGVPPLDEHTYVPPRHHGAPGRHRTDHQYNWRTAR